MKKIICLFIMAMLIGGCGPSEEEKQANGLNEVNKIMRKAHTAFKLSDQNKAFGELLFGDDLQTVVTKLRGDSNLEVTYPDSKGSVFARFYVNKAQIFVLPKFYEGKLYEVVLNGLNYDNYCYSCAEKDFYTFVDMIKEKYGPPDSISDNTPTWDCGRKMIIVHGLGTIRASCIIFEKEIAFGIIDQKEKQKQKEISEKGGYF